MHNLVNHKQSLWILILSVFCLYPYRDIAAQVNKPVIVPSYPSANNVAPLPSDYSVGVLVNYVRTWDAQGSLLDANTFSSQSYTKVKQTTGYFDGLGRPLQTVIKEITSDATPKDLVSPFVYDDLGREQYKYMGYVSASNDGNLRLSPFTEENSYLQSKFQNEQVFYTETKFDASPLSRPIKQFNQGNSWGGSGIFIEQKYLINTLNDGIRQWSISYDISNFNNNIPVSNSIYPAGELYKNVTKDENENSVVEYKDKEGKVILKKVQFENIPVSNTDFRGHDYFLCTYYVYDDYGRLRFVIPPKAVSELKKPSINWDFANTSNVADELCFRYEYNSRGRIVAKKVPGAGWVSMVYDYKDRLVFTQDANMQSKNQWMTILYDYINRPTITGLLTYSGSLAYLSTIGNNVFGTGNTNSISLISVTGNTASSLPVNSTLSSAQTNTTLHQASNSIILDEGFETDNTSDFTAEIILPNNSTINQNVSVSDNPIPSGSNFIPLTITYYDNYSFNSNPTLSYSTSNNANLDYGNNENPTLLPSTVEQSKVETRGKITGTTVRTLPDVNDLSSGIWLKNINFYDDKGRTIQTQSDNYKGGVDISTNLYDFTNKILCNYLVHTNPQNPVIGLKTIGLKTNMEYDHAGRLLEVYKSLNGSTKKLIAKNEYDDLGRVIKKSLGTNSGTSTPLESFEYTYNIRGWLKGINQDYANNQTSNNQSLNHWFGMELNYDWGFTHNEVNGNIAGTKWRSKGDGEQRAYGFGYDKVNRLLFSDFNQYTNSNWDKSAGVDFTSLMGDGINSNTAYDENGNILKMKQWGLKLGGSSVIDNLSYNYTPNSNKLLNVIDAVNDNATKLGDFRASSIYQLFTPVKSNTTEDYKYDDNGNLIIDRNKDIFKSIATGITYQYPGGPPITTYSNNEPGIIYNFLNLPQTINIAKFEGGPYTGNYPSKGTINYIYDASGNKLEKVVNEIGQPEKKTTYIGGFIYENNDLKFFAQEEGRIRVIPNTQTPNTYDFVYDYFVKDHLGNVRAVLTEEQKQDNYPAATMETAASSIEEKFYTNIPQTRTDKPVGYPTDNTTNPNDKVAKVNGNGNKIGPSIILKVMAGDQFNVKVSSWYKTQGATPNSPINPLPDLVSALINSISGASALGSNHGVVDPTELANTNVINPTATSFLNNVDNNSNSTKPRAYLNWILVDEQFKLVSSSSGFEQVGDNEEFKLHVKNNMPIDKNGYLYVYVSNSTPNIDVFFDNLQITHIKGPLLEETHYYPFGLVMSGISGKAAGTIQNIEKTFQGQRFDDELGLNWIQFKWRNHDIQIGRFVEIDPLSEKYEYNSTYAFSENKVTNHVELEGLEAVSAGNPMGYVVEGFREMLQAGGRAIDKINPFHGGEVHDNLEAKVTVTGGLASGGSVETSTTVPLAEKSTLFKVGSFEELFKSGKGPIEYTSVNSTMTKVEQKNAFNTIIRGVPTEFSQKTTVDKNSTTVSVGAKAGTGNLLDKSKVEAGADLYYKNQTSGVGMGKTVGIKISADATFVVKQVNVLNTPLVQVKATVQNKVGGSFFLDWRINK